MAENFTEVLRFGQYSVGIGVDTISGVQRLTIQINPTNTTPLIATPVITMTSTPGTNPPTWSAVMSELQVGDTIELDFTSNGSSPDGVAEQSHSPVTSDEALTGDISWSSFTGFTAGQTVKWRQRYGRLINGIMTWSNWSNTLSDVVNAVVFTPASVPSIVDYGEVRAAKLWKDTGGTVPVTADGDIVARWDGEMGAIIFTQSTLANRPIYHVSGAIEKLTFDGTNDQMTSGAVSYVQPFFEAVAAKATSLAVAHTLLGTTTSGQRGDLLNSATPKFDIYASNFVADWGLTPTTNDAVYAGSFNGAGSVATIDNVAGTTNNAGTTAPVGLQLGADSANSQQWVGDMHGFVIVGAIPSAGDKASINTWLGALQGRTI